MKYRASRNRCAVVLNSLNLPINDSDIVCILRQKGFNPVDVDIVKLARQCIGKSIYCRGARFADAPNKVDCSSFIKWIYSMRGIWLPRRSIQQLGLGDKVHLGDIVAGDVVFTSGFIDYYYDDPKKGVGHVGMSDGKGMIIHAANAKDNVVETPIERFVANDKFRGVRRYLPSGMEVLTLKTPVEREVETSDDIRWIVLQSLPSHA